MSCVHEINGHDERRNKVANSQFISDINCLTTQITCDGAYMNRAPPEPSVDEINIAKMKYIFDTNFI